MKKILLIVAISFCAGLFLAGLIFVYFPEKNTQATIWEEEPSPSSSSILYAAQPPQTEMGLDFATIAAKVGPAVVRIEADKIEKQTMSGFFDDSPFDDFWDRFFGTPRNREQEYRSKTGGTGFFISSDGFILTNNHIVENAVKVKVTSMQGDEFAAEIKCSRETGKLFLDAQKKADPAPEEPVSAELEEII